MEPAESRAPEGGCGVGGGGDADADRAVLGEPMDFPGLTNEPTTESGVVYVFGLVAERLGFRVRWLQTGFPDCEALRRVGAGKWQPVRIEFEYLSGNFLLHKHPAAGCDLIVCWEDNWAGCPVEVIALRDYVAQRGMTKPEARRGESGNQEIRKKDDPQISQMDADFFGESEDARDGRLYHHLWITPVLTSARRWRPRSRGCLWGVS